MSIDKRKTIIGIDPGLTGAVAAINTEGDVTFEDTPTRKVKIGKRLKTEYIPSQMASIFTGYDSMNCHVFIENVWAMPGEGVTATFGFGKGFGIWIGILAALRIPYTLVTPQSWKKEMGIRGQCKDAARIVAQQLSPKSIDELSRKKDIGRADALLIAAYGWRYLQRGGLI